MKITAVNTKVTWEERRNWVIIKVITDKKLVGWGEATLEGKEKYCASGYQRTERTPDRLRPITSRGPLLSASPYRPSQHGKGPCRSDGSIADP